MLVCSLLLAHERLEAYSSPPLVDPNLIDDNGLKLSFGSYWNGMYQVGLWPDVNNQASVRLICFGLIAAVSHELRSYVGNSRNTLSW